MTTRQWTTDVIQQKIATSDAWAARAVFLLGSDYDKFQSTCGFTENVKHDKLFFTNFHSYYKTNGHFTARQLKIGRGKIRQEHLEYLVSQANLNS